MKNKTTVFAANGIAWELEAVNSIAAWFSLNVPQVTTIR